MSSERVLRSRSVGAPSRLPRARGVQIPNTLSAPQANEGNKLTNQGNLNSEGVYNDLERRISEVESNVGTIIDNQLKKCSTKIDDRFFWRQ